MLDSAVFWGMGWPSFGGALKLLRTLRRPSARFLNAMFEGMGDEVETEFIKGRAILRQTGLRVVRGMEVDDRSDLLCCWTAIWKGTLASHRAFLDLAVDDDGDCLIWTIST